MITWLTIKALLLDENIFWTFAILLFTFSYIAFSILTIRGKCSSSFLYLAAMAFVASWLCIIPLNIGSFWATLKRGVYGIYHHVSVKYMQRYVDEFCFRYNNRKKDLFNIVLSQSILKQEGVANHA